MLSRAPSPQVVSSATVFNVLSHGKAAFPRILDRIAEARRSIALRAFDWRDDATGQAVGHALLAAGERGVAVKILKDRVGMHYEYFEGNNQSLFHKDIDLRTRLSTWLLMASYGRWGSLAQTPSPLAQALLAHENITVAHEEKRYDHAKVYVFDDEHVILGGMGIGDDFQHENVDFMIDVSGADAASRLADGRVAFDPERTFDYLLHSHEGTADHDTIATQRLRLIGSARHRLTIEMAYIGDAACTEALIQAVERGVQVTLLTAARANVIADLNLHTCAELLSRTGGPSNLRIVLHPRMVHGKAIVGDGEWVDVGSTNFTPLSHGGYEEVDLFCREPGFVRSVEAAIWEDTRDGVEARLPLSYNRLYAQIERAVAAYQARRRAP